MLRGADVMSARIPARIKILHLVNSGNKSSRLILVFAKSHVLSGTVRWPSVRPCSHWSCSH